MMKNHVKVKSDEQVVGKVTQLQEEEKSLLKQLEQRNKEMFDSEAYLNKDGIFLSGSAHSVQKILTSYLRM